MSEEKDMPEAREDVIAAVCAKTGKTREQVEAFLDILGSGLRRRGFANNARLLNEDEIRERLNTFLGQGPE